MTTDANISSKRYSKQYWGLSLKSIGILTLVFIGFAYITYLFWMPYLAERHFRDGYNNTVMKRYKLAIHHLKKAQHYAPWETHYQSQLGTAYHEYAKIQPSKRLKLHYYTQLIALYHNMIRLDPHSPWFHHRLSLLYVELIGIDPDHTNDYQALALDHSKKAAYCDQQNPMFQLNYATHLHRYNHFDKAKTYYLKALNYDPRMVAAYYNLADIYRNEGKLDQTLHYYLQLYDKNPDYPNLNLAIANTYITLNQNTNAITYLETAASRNALAGTLETLGTIYSSNQQWSHAARVYKQYFDTHGLSEKLHPYYIQALLKTGKKADIVTAYKSLYIFVQKFPDNELGKTQLTQLQPYITIQPQ